MGMELLGPATKKRKEGEKTEREYLWEDRGEDFAVLYGPEPYTVAAVIRLDPGTPDQMDGCWRITSGRYSLLNLEERDTSIPLKQMKDRALILLGQELRQRQEDVEADMASVRSLLFADMPDDPYETY